MTGWRLYADAGNTNLTWGAWDGASWIASGSAPTAGQASSGRQAVRHLPVLSSLGIASDEALGAALMSSSPARTERALAALRWMSGLDEVALLGRDMYSDLDVRYHDLSQVGQDRLAMAEGACERFGPPVVVLGVGTCVTAQALTSEAEFVGGGIAPGLPALAAGIRFSAEHLADDVDEAVRMLAEGNELPAEAQSTAENLAAGLLAALVGAVERLSATMRELVGSDAPVVATGGDAKLVAGATDVIDEVDEMLALDGLRLIDELRRAEG